MNNKVINYNAKTKIDGLTGAVKGAAIIGLSSLIVLSSAFRVASIECDVNHSATTVCPITKLETFLFGVEAGMQHQARDLESYKVSYVDHTEYTSDVEYLSDEEGPRVLFCEIENYDGIMEVNRKMWTYQNGEYIQVALDDAELTKTLSK